MKELIRDIFTPLTPKEKKRVALLIFLNTAINLADVFSLVCLLFVIKFYTQPPAPVDRSLSPGIFTDRNSLLPILALLAMFTVKNVAGHLVYKAQAGFISGVAVRLSRRGLASYLAGTYSDHANTDPSVFISKIVHQPTEYAQYVLQSAQQTVSELLLIVFSITALMIYNAHLFIIVFVVMLPAVVILYWLTKRQLEQIKKNIKVAVERSLQYLNEALSGYVESNIYNRNTFFVDRHEQAQKNVAGHITGIQATQDIPARFFEVFAILGLFVLIVAIKYVSDSYTDVVIIGAFVAAAYKIIPSISRIINLTGQIRTYRYAIDGIKTSNPTAQKQKMAQQPIRTITFNEIAFAYGELKVLEQFNCRINVGSLIGISGDSGSGKTTILQLLLGFCAPDKGNILFNDTPVSNDTRMAYWDSTAYVKQDPFILHDTMLNNIVLFEKHYDVNRLNEVLDATGIREITDRHEDGIHMQIMDTGKNLSGGQRKRIAIARALYKDAALILLDEPFSELDEASGQKILQYLKQLTLKGKTVIMISHNHNDLRYCDDIIHVS